MKSKLSGEVRLGQQFWIQEYFFPLKNPDKTGKKIKNKEQFGPSDNHET